MKVKELLERKEIKVIKECNGYYLCEYKGNEIEIQHNDANINPTYSLYINGKTIMTKAYITTCISKILNLKEEK